MTAPMPTDEMLVARVVAGEEGAFAALMERHWSRVHRLAQRFLGRAEAEEVAQEVFLAVYQKLGQFEGKSAFSTWLYRVAVNMALMRLRSEGRAETVPLEQMELSGLAEEEDEPPPEGRIMTEQSLGLIERAMERMPPELKTIFILRDVEGFSNEETAEIMGLSVAAVKSRLHRGREFLRGPLKDLYQNTVEN
jgi:RNA polymerase sigma-70 factor, ECF subfamily